MLILFNYTIYFFFPSPTIFFKWHSEGKSISKWNFTDNLFQLLIYFLLKIKLSRQEKLLVLLWQNKWEFLIHRGWKHKTLISLYIQYYNKLISCGLLKHLRLHIHTCTLKQETQDNFILWYVVTTKRKNITDLHLIVFLAYNHYTGQA